MARATISDQLREIILSRGPGHAVARSAGVDPGIISRFLRHERGLTLETLNRLAEALGLRLVEIPRAADQPRKPAGAPVRTAQRPGPMAAPRFEPEPAGPVESAPTAAVDPDPVPAIPGEALDGPPGVPGGRDGSDAGPVVQ